MLKPPSVPFAAQFRLSLLAVVLLSSAITGGGLSFISFEAQLQQLDQVQRARSQATAEKINNYVDDLQRSLSGLARVRGLTAFDAATLETLLEALMNHNRAYDAVGVTDQQGRVRLSRVAPDQTVADDWSATTAFRRAFQEQEDFIGPVELEPAAVWPTLVLAMPIRDPHNVVAGIIFAKVNLKFLQAILAGIDADQRGEVYALDQRDLIIARSSGGPARAALNTLSPLAATQISAAGSDSTPHVYTGLSEAQVLGNVVEVSSTHWRIVSELPVQAAYAPVLNLLAVVGLGLAAGLLVAGWLGALLARQVTQPLRQLTQAAARLSEGALETRVAIVQQNELGVLASAFNHMAAQLQATVVDLQGRMAELVAAQRALQASEARYRLLAENMADVIWVLNVAQMKFTYVSPSVKRLRGYTPEAVLAEPLDQALTPASAQHIHALLAERLPRFMAEPGQTRYYTDDVDQPCADGRIVHTEVTTTYCLNAAGEVEIIGVSRDSTKRREAETALRESQATLTAIVDSTSDLIWSVDPETFGLLTFNRGLQDYYLAQHQLSITAGMRPEELHAAADVAERWQAFYQRALAEGPYTTEYQAFESPRILWLSFNLLRRDDVIFGVSVFGQDITQRKQAEEALRASEARFRTLSDNALTGIYIVQDDRLTYVNAALAEIFGYRPDELIGAAPLVVIYPEDQALVTGLMSRRLSGELAAAHYEFRGLSKTGEVKQIEVWGARVDLKGRPAIIGNLLDVTERKRAEARLRQLSRAVEQSPVSILITDPAGVIEYVNPKFTQVTGYALSEAVGRNPRFLKSGETPPEVYQQLWRTLLAGQEWRGEFHNRKKNGELYWESASISPVVDAAGVTTHYLAVKEDITARKQEERQRAAIITVSAALRAAADQATMLPAILDQTRALLDVEDVAFVRLVPETGATVVELARGAWEASVGQERPANVGIAAQVLATGQSYLNNQIAQEPLTSRLGLSPNIVAVAAVPLIAQGRALGVLNVGSRWPLEAIQLRLLEAIGDIAANALQRASLFEQTLRRADQFTALYATARELAAQQDLPWLLETIVTRALDLVPASGALITLYDPAREDLAIAVVRGLPLAPGARLRLGEGAAGRSAQTWQPLMVDDYHQWEGRSPQLEAVPLSALLSVPMLSGGNLIGVIVLADLEPTGRRFSRAEADLITLLASHAGSAVHNANILEEARLRADQLALLYDAGLALNSVLEPEAQLEFLSRIARQALHADVIEFFRVDTSTQALRVELSLGYSEAARAKLNDLGQLAGEARGLAGVVAQSRLPVTVADLYADPRHVVLDTDLRAGVWVPVQHQGHLRGVLGVLSRRPQAFSDKDEQLLLLFANQTAVAIQNAHLFAETERRLRHVQALRQIDVTIASNLELRPILKVLLEQTFEQLNVAAVVVRLLDSHTQMLEPVASRGFRTPAVERARTRLGETPIGRSRLPQALVAIPDLAQSPERLGWADWLAGEGFVAYYAAPLISRGQIKGVLEVFQRAPREVDAEWLDYLETLAGQAALAVDNVGLLDELQRSNAELTQAYDATIVGWSRALDLRDKETEGHSQRVTDLTVALAQAMGIGAEERVHLRRGALLHDIGKMGVPDAILLKPGPLTEAEWASMRRHPELAYEMLAPITFLRPALDIPYCHHEKWDGSGYPRGLKAEQIPLVARLFAVVDVWDAVCSDRPYRPAWSRSAARDYIRQQAGKHFDPAVAQAFLDLEAGLAQAPLLTA